MFIYYDRTLKPSWDWNQQPSAYRSSLYIHYLYICLCQFHVQSTHCAPVQALERTRQTYRAAFPSLVLSDPQMVHVFTPSQLPGRRCTFLLPTGGRGGTKT